MQIPKNNLPRQDANAFQSFDSTVRDICAYLGDDEAKTLYIRTSRFLRMALEELDLYLFVSGVKSTFLKIEDNMTVNLPKDFQTLGKVGVCCNNGSIRLIGRNDDLCPPSEQPLFDCCDCSKGVKEVGESVSAVDGGEACCSACTFHNVDGTSNSSLGRYYGLSTNYYSYLYGYTPKMFRNGTYRMDEGNWRLILGDGCDTRPGQEILLEYNAAMSDDKYDLIPRKAVPTLMYKTAHMIKMNNNPNAAMAEWSFFKKHYQQLKKTYQTYTLEDLVSALRKGYKSSVKR